MPYFHYGFSDLCSYFGFFALPFSLSFHPDSPPLCIICVLSFLLFAYTCSETFMCPLVYTHGTNKGSRSFHLRNTPFVVDEKGSRSITQRGGGNPDRAVPRQAPPPLPFEGKQMAQPGRFLPQRSAPKRPTKKKTFSTTG